VVGGTRYFLGLDGGATRCRLRLRDSQGVRLAEAEGGAVNIYVDFEKGLAGVGNLAVEILGTAGIPLSAQKETAFGLGLAGLASEEDARRVVEALPGWARVEAVNDAVTACIGGNAGSEGGLIIAGTGTAGIARAGGKTTIVGGRGFYLGDDGSGARIGADAARAAMRAHDGLEPMSGLSASILARFGDDVIAFMRWGLTARPGDFGAFAPDVFAAARDGEPGALDIVARAAHAISVLQLRLADLGASRIAYVGGVAEPLRAYLPAEVSQHLHAPLGDAIDGAIIMMGGAIAEDEVGS
jgi:glucosamine kinase